MAATPTNRTAGDPGASPEDFAKINLKRLALVLLSSAGLCLAAVLAAMVHVTWMQSVGVIVLTGLTAGAGGAAIGFLFGIPRVLAGDAVPASAAADGAATPAAAPAGGGQAAQGDQPAVNQGQQSPTGAAPSPVGASRRLLGSNSNLEQVSDWLTKIIVGLTLVEFHRINDALLSFRDLVAQFTPPSDTLTPLVAPIVLVFGAIAGFMWMYLETRIVLSRIFDGVERILQNALDRANSQVRKQAVALELISANTTSKTSGDLSASADTLKAAAASGGNNPNLRSLAAGVLARSGRVQEAIDILPNTNDVAAQIGLMQVALYQPPPQGYQRVISISAGLIDNPAARRRADFWFYLAAAFGQQYSNLPPDKEQERASARANALDTARRCVKADPSYKLRIAWLMHPERSPTPEDDDLSAFAGDPDFEALIS